MTAGSRRTDDSNPHRLPILLGLAVSVLAGTVAILAGPRPVGAQEAQPVGEPVHSLHIVDQTTFVAADGALDVMLDVTTPTLGPDGTADDGAGTDRGTGGDADSGDTDSSNTAATEPVLSVTVYGRLGSEDEVDAALTQPLNRLPSIPLADLPATEAGYRYLSVPVRSGGRFDDRDRVLLPEPGVYPVTIELRDGEGPLASVRTHLVRQPTETSDLDTEAEAPLPISLVLHLTTAEGLSADEAAVLLRNHPGVPMTVVLGSGVANQLRAEPETLQALAEALDGRPVLVSPTIDLDPSALAEIDQDDLYVEAADADRDLVEQLGLTPADGMTLLDAPLTASGIEVLHGLGIEAVLDTEERLVGSGRIDHPDPLTVLRADRDLNRILGGTDAGGVVDGPHRANRVLARLTLRREVDDSPVVLGSTDLGVDPGPALAALLRSLSQPGAPRPIPLDEAGGGPTVRVAERPQQDLRPVAEAVAELRDRLDTFDRFHHGGGPLPEDYRRRLVAALTRQRNPEDRARALTLIASQLDDDLGVIAIHRPQPVTLAARSAPIPLVVDNEAAGPRSVLLRFRSDKVVSADDGRILLVQPGTSSIDVEVEARSLGVSPLEISVWTPDGATRLDATRFEIRSTAVPGLGLLVSLSALGLLGLWWLLDHRKRRRPHPDPALDAPGPPTER